MIRKLSSILAASAIALAAAPALAQPGSRVASAEGAQPRDCCARMHCNSPGAASSESATGSQQARATSSGGALQNDPHAKSYVEVGG